MAATKTINLQRTWQQQREQMLEERTHTQSGLPRSADDIAIVDHDIAVMDYLIALPMGAKFDSREIDMKVAKARAS